MIEKEEKFEDGGDLSELVYLSLSNDIMDFMKFMQRILSFYQYNFDQAKNHCNLSAKQRLDSLINRIIPSCKELKQILKHKRKSRGKSKLLKDFPTDDENIIYIVILKILESYHLEFECRSKRDTMNKYHKYFLPLAIELYSHHVNSSDLILLNSLLRCSTTFNKIGVTKKLNPSLHSYFPNLDDMYNSKFQCTSQVLLEVSDYVAHFKQQQNSEKN